MATYATSARTSAHARGFTLLELMVALTLAGMMLAAGLPSFSTFLRNAEGKRPVYGGTEKFQNDPHWKDLILFYEYFHGDNGAGLGASHQTGWTGLVAPLLDLYGRLDAKTILETERRKLQTRMMMEQVAGEHVQT